MYITINKTPLIKTYSSGTYTKTVLIISSHFQKWLLIKFKRKLTGHDYGHHHWLPSKASSRFYVTVNKTSMNKTNFSGTYIKTIFIFSLHFHKWLLMKINIWNTLFIYNINLSGTLSWTSSWTSRPSVINFLYNNQQNFNANLSGTYTKTLLILSSHFQKFILITININIVMDIILDLQGKLYKDLI